MPEPQAVTKDEVLNRLSSLRQHRRKGQRSPHKPLLLLFAIGRLSTTGTSAIEWSAAESQLAELIQDYGPPATSSRIQRAAYPFTHLRTDKVWTLNHDVPMDDVRPLAEHHVVGRLEPWLEDALRDPEIATAAARRLVETEFPPTVAPDVLAAVGLDPDVVLGRGATTTVRARRSEWPREIINAWDRQCAFCGFDGQLGDAVVGVEAAHVRWFNFGGPDEADNGMALCSLHHKLFDRGALGLDASMRINVSGHFYGRTDPGKAVYDLHRRALRPRPGTALPATEHVEWHWEEVFKSPALVA